jgi:DNA-binding NarL/FixJ family response regulator
MVYRHHSQAGRLRKPFPNFGKRSQKVGTCWTGCAVREREILDLLAAGRNNGEIAGELFLSLKTVRNYVSNIFTKLQVADCAQAIVRAREAGLGRNGGEA